MTKRIFRAICITASTVLAATLALAFAVLYRYSTNTCYDQLKVQAELVVHGVEMSGMNYFNELETGDYRVTIVDKDGSIVYDSDSNAADMENHMERNEIQEAFKYGEGKSKRYSSTLMERYLYYAKLSDNGMVVRMSVSQQSVLKLLLGLLSPIVLILIVVGIFSVALAKKLSQSIVKPLNEINLDEPLENEGYDELSPLLRRIDSQQKQLKSQQKELQRKKDEFEAITDKMKEGLALLNSKSHIVSINHAANEILGIENIPDGKDIFAVCRNSVLREALEEAKNNDHVVKMMDMNGRKYQLDVNQVYSDGDIVGTVLLFFDVTDRENSEKMRREFTANVSHELKTPLHSINGYAELMATGIAKKEDYVDFAQKIYAEGKRMVQLVEDIINLSHLEEDGADIRKESVDLYSSAQDVIWRLETVAYNSGVSIALSGVNVEIEAVPQMIQEIIYNLCDNAIKYNRKDGRVDVTVEKEDGKAVLTVKDTGIGIPPEHRARIFERFYRVDKSHSKEVGGTGLGLSIVKHAAKIHNAQVEMESVEGEGTTFRVKFPLAK